MASIKYGDLSNQEKLIISQMMLARYVRGGEGGYLPTSAICRLIGTINESRVRKVLHSLYHRGYVARRVNGMRNYVWQVVSEVQESVENDCFKVTTYSFGTLQIPSRENGKDIK